MSDKTGIQWTDATWNPIRGCTRVSEGCRNCYAEAVAARFSGPGLPYHGIATQTTAGPRWTGTIRIVQEHMNDPLKWTKPRRVFVNSMSDLFHEGIPFHVIDDVFCVMREARRHTFQVLTKRPARMLEWAFSTNARFGDLLGAHVGAPFNPLPNVWLGVSCEDQATAEERIPLLLQMPSAIRFISAEPLLGRINLRAALVDPFDGAAHIGGLDLPPLDWVIIGGESGPHARPCAIEWIQDIVTQCHETVVPVFVKQLGAHLVSEDRTLPGDSWLVPSQVCEANRAPDGDYWAWRAGFRDRKGGNPEEWPEELRVREWPVLGA